jgi:DNA-binding NarL/FixJ family response regulator
MENLGTDHCPLRILHLDDHRLFLDGMRMAILSRYPKATIDEFHSNDKALSRLKALLVNNEKPDLIITDFNHLGGNGLDFAEDAKLLCEKHGTKIPIIMVTMRQEKDTIPDGLEGSSLDGFLTKASSAEDILDLIQALIPPALSGN